MTDRANESTASTVGPDHLIMVGLMSGTSVDSIDAALVEFDASDGRLSWRLREFLSVPWRSDLRSEILDCCGPDAGLQRVAVLNYRLGEEFARAAIAVVDEAGLSLSEVDAIASHGQTIWHQPEPIVIADIAVRATVQIGEPAVIAARTGRPVIADFRASDIASGGLGAPLVPFVDHALFSHQSETRALQNIGGISNVTFLAAGGTLDDVVAFDTGPGGVLINAVAVRATAGRLLCDVNGLLAAQGRVLKPLLAEFLLDPYYAAPPPKATGRELFSTTYTDRFFQRGIDLGGSPFDIAATATVLTVETIAGAYERWLESNSVIDVAVVSGGGSRNPVLMAMLRDRLFPRKVLLSSDLGLPEQAKEAVAFAVLGYQTLRGRASNAPAATGASAHAVLGKLVQPPRIGNSCQGQNLRWLLDKAGAADYNL